MIVSYRLTSLPAPIDRCAPIGAPTAFDGLPDLDGSGRRSVTEKRGAAMATSESLLV